MRVILAAVALSALSFIAGVVGDLSSAPANSGAVVTLRIPPPIPADAPRAAPLPLLSTPTAAAEARRVTPLAQHFSATVVMDAPVIVSPPKRRERVLVIEEPKVDARIAAKQDRKKGG
jgi:hypothetical protein